MQMVFYALMVLSSFSLGYGVLRAGFPSKQALPKLQKIGFGYLLGVIIFAPGLVLSLFFGDLAFFATILILASTAFLFALLKRKINKETDSITLIKEKKKVIELPKMVLTKEEKEKMNSQQVEAQKEAKNEPVKVISASQLKGDIFKEKNSNVILEVKKKTSDLEQRDKEKQKKEAMAKLRNYASQIAIEKKSVKKDKKQTGEEIDIAELERMVK